MGYGGLWLTRCMAYEGFDCIWEIYPQGSLSTDCHQWKQCQDVIFLNVFHGRTRKFARHNNVIALKFYSFPAYIFQSIFWKSRLGHVTWTKSTLKFCSVRIVHFLPPFRKMWIGERTPERGALSAKKVTLTRLGDSDQRKKQGRIWRFSAAVTRKWWGRARRGRRGQKCGRSLWNVRNVVWTRRYNDEMSPSSLLFLKYLSLKPE
jgi:hypothetical protein